MEDHRTRPHVLVVDDDSVWLELTKQWLEDAGYRVSGRTAAVGTAADVVNLEPDVLLLDVLMPGLRGDDLARLLKRHPSTRHVPIVLYSSLESARLSALVMATGAIGAIEKTSSQASFTFSLNCLMMKLRSVRRHHAPRASVPAPAASGTYRVEADHMGSIAPASNRKLG